MKFAPTTQKMSRQGERRVLRAEKRDLLRTRDAALPGSATFYRTEKRLQQIDERLRELTREAEAPAEEKGGAQQAGSGLRPSVAFMPPRGLEDTPGTYRRKIAEQAAREAAQTKARENAPRRPTAEPSPKPKAKATYMDPVDPYEADAGTPRKASNAVQTRRAFVHLNCATGASEAFPLEG